MLVPVENSISLKRETSSGGIVNTNESEYLAIKKAKENRKNKDQKIQQELDQLKAMLASLMEKQNG